MPYSYTCSCCGEVHHELPFSWHVPAPAYWHRDWMGRDEPGFYLHPETCVINNEHFYVRALVELPVLDAQEGPFGWGVWVSLSETNFKRMLDLWDTPGRENEPSYFGWFSSQLPIYPIETVGLKTRLHTRPVGLRPWLELEPTDHPLAVEQRTGITLARVQEIAESMLHPGGKSTP